MFEQYLNPKMIFNLIKNNADYKKIAMNIINSEEAKDFVISELGLDYNDLKQNISLAVMNTKKSTIGIQRQQEIEHGQKLQIYKELANSLIKEDGLSVYSAIILAAGFAGIEQTKVVDFLKMKGYSATKQRIEHYYNTNEGFLKTLLKRKGKIITGWNDSIESADLDLDNDNGTNEKLVEMPDNSVKDELGVEEN